MIEVFKDGEFTKYKQQLYLIENYKLLRLLKISDKPGVYNQNDKEYYVSEEPDFKNHSLEKHWLSKNHDVIIKKEVIVYNLIDIIQNKTIEIEIDYQDFVEGTRIISQNFNTDERLIIQNYLKLKEFKKQTELLLEIGNNLLL